MPVYASLPYRLPLGFNGRIKDSDFISTHSIRSMSRNQLLQLRTARTVFSILVTVRLYTVMPEACHCLTNEKQRKTDISLTDNN